MLGSAHPPVFCLFILFLLASTIAQQVEASPKFSIVWATDTHTGSTNFLKDNNNQALNSGQSINGDGDLVELGYFSQGSFAHPLQDNAFLGEWIPLTQNTRVGDSSSGYGFSDGMLAFRTTFTRDANYVTTYWGEPKYFVEYLNFQISSTTPPPQTTPVCVRFYDSPFKGGGARFNTVTGPGWRWPTFPNGSNIPTTSYFKIASGNAPAGSFWIHGSTFEDPNAPFVASKLPDHSIHFEVLAGSENLGTIKINDQNTTFTFNAQPYGTIFNLKAIPGPHSYFNRWVGTGIDEFWNESTTLLVDGDQNISAEFAKVPYLLNLSSLGEGMVYGSGSFSYGDQVLIEAHPNSGHSFTRWEINGTHFSNNQFETVSIDGDMDLVAVFTRNTYQVLVSDTDGGTYEILDVNGSTPQTFQHGFQYTLRSLPDDHFGFDYWDTSDAGLSMIAHPQFAETTFIPVADVNITAIFSEMNYELNVKSTQGYSSLSPSGKFPALSIIPVDVEVQEGFVFDYWQDPLGILSNSYSANTEANMSKIYPYQSTTVSAILRLDDYEVTDINITSGSGGNIFLESDNSGGFTHFTSYELNASANLGYQFNQWEGDTDQLESGPYAQNNKVLIEGPLSLRAEFSLIQYKLNLSSTGDGSPTGPEFFTINDNPSITAFAFPGARFTHWSGDTDYLLNHLSSQTSIELDNNSMPKDLELVANFVPENYQLYLNTEGNGSVDLFLSNGEVYDGVISKSLTADSETQITLDAYAGDGWSFSNWRGLPDLSQLVNPIAYVDQYSSVSYFYPPSDLNLTAVFKITEYDESQVVVSAQPGGDIFLEREPNGKLKHFSTYDLNATPLRGYEFTGWELDPTQLSSLIQGISNPINHLVINGEMEINASFSPIEYTIAITNSEGGETNASTSYTVSQNPLLKAFENPGWNFSHWSGDVQYLANSNSSQTSIVHNSLPLKNLSFTANFVRESYQISLTTEGSGNFDLTKNGLGFVNGSTEQIVTIDSSTRLGANASPTSGWKFSRWFGLPVPSSLRDPSPSLDPLSPAIHFIPVEDTNISLKFERESYSLSIIQPTFGGSATGGGTFKFESLVDINASPQEHFRFSGWNGAGSNLVYESGVANNQIIIPATDISLEPIFLPKIYSVHTFSDENGTFETSGTYNLITQNNQTEYNATSSLTVSALPLNSDSHMLNYLYWENTLGESGFSYASTINLPFLDANYSFWAYFTERNEIGYSLIASPPYAGTAGENTAYSSAQLQRLVAQPNPGYSFIGWESKTGEGFLPNWGIHSVDAKLQDTSEIWAHFEPQSLFLTLQYNEDQGEISGFSEQKNYGSNLTITAYPDENFTFVNWELIKETTFDVTRDQSSIHSSETKLFINNQESPELSLIRGFTYHFDCNLNSGDEFFLSTSADTSSVDSYYQIGVTGHLNSSGTLTFVVPMEAPNTLYYHASGKNFSGNRIKISTIEDSSILPSPTNPVFSSRVTHNFGLRANFERTRHTISLNKSGEGTVNLAQQDIYFWGDVVAISATPSDHWYFSHWEGSSHIPNPQAPETTLRVMEDSDIRAVFQPFQYVVDVNSSPAEYGVIDEPTDTYTYGEYVTLSATPLTGKQFDEWVGLENLSLNNPDDRFKPTAQFKVLGNANAQANFSRISMHVDIQFHILDMNDQQILGDIGASVTIPETIYHGDTVTLSLTPFTGYTFLYWVDLESGEKTTSQKSFTTSITSDQNFMAVLRKQYYQLEVSGSNGGTAETNASAPYYWGDEISLNAIADEHWEFDRWTGVGSEHIDNTSSQNTFITVQKDSSIIAEFKPKGYELDVLISPEGYGGHSSIETSYQHGEIVSLEANPKNGKLFLGWKHDNNASLMDTYSNTDNPAEFKILGNTKLTALFDSREYNISYQVVVVDHLGIPKEGVFGGIIVGPSKAKDGKIVEFHLSLANGYKLDIWQDAISGNALSSEMIYKHTMSSDLNLTAVVTERKYGVELKISPQNGGTAQLNEFPVSQTFYDDDFAYGEEINLTASPKPGYRFVKWSATGVALGSPSQTNQSFLLGNDIKLTAYYAPTTNVTLDLLSKPAEAASYFFGNGSFPYNPDHSILVMAKQGYDFSHWEYNGSIAVGVVKDAYSSTTTIALDNNKSLTAVFNTIDPPEQQDELYLLSVFSGNTNQGTTRGSGFYRGNRTIYAYPKQGFEFSHWEGGTFSNPYDSITQISVFQKTSVVAHFQSVGVFEDSEALDNGWWGNPWFGYFWKVGEQDWLFHEKLGWIFMKKKGDQSIWVWIQKMEDWFWTAKEHYPYLHSSNSQSWYFVNLERTNFSNLIIFDYQTSKWISK